MKDIRKSAVAGSFYPSDPLVLRQQVEQFLNETTAMTTTPKAIIAPHAGFVYSGPVAAAAYAQLQPLHDKISRVILLGPSHRVAFLGIAASSANAYQTPLGNISIDHESQRRILELPYVRTYDDAHLYEHSLEVHLPFLQIVLDQFSLVPLVVGETEPEMISEVLDALAPDDNTIIVVSTDLSHYHSYKTAQKMDQATSDAIESLHYTQIKIEDACGRNPVKGLLKYAQSHHLQAHLLDLRNSGDTAGSKDKVVGYGSYVIQ